MSLPSRIASFIQAQRALNQRNIERAAEAEADFERIVIELGEVANPPIQQKSDWRSATGIDPLPKDRDPWSFLDWRTNSRGEWFFADDKKAKVLVAKIGNQKGNVFIDGGYSYTITTGNNGKKFINRSRSK